MKDARITIHSATDILELVPTLLGFIPTESLVSVYLQSVDGRIQVAMAARVDLPLGHDETALTLRMLDRHAARYDAMILVAYSLDTAAADSALVSVIQDSRWRIQIAVSAGPEGWAEVGLGMPTSRYAYPDGTSRVAAEIVAAGVVRPQGGRDDLRASISPPEEADAREFAALVASSEPMTQEDLTAWLQRWISRDECERTSTVSRGDAAVLVASLDKIDKRDAAWAAITCGDADCHVNLWRQVSRWSDGTSSLPVLGLLGMAAWVAGQGALANLVLDRAERTEGYAAYSLFDLLRKILIQGVDPATWDSLREAIVGAAQTPSYDPVRNR